MIGESNKTATEKRVAAALVEQKQLHSTALNSQKLAAAAEYDSLNKNYKENVAAMDERYKRELAEKDLALDKATKEARADERQRIINAEAHDMAKKRIIRYYIVFSPYIYKHLILRR